MPRCRRVIVSRSSYLLHILLCAIPTSTYLRSNRNEAESGLTKIFAPLVLKGIIQRYIVGRINTRVLFLIRMSPEASEIVSNNNQLQSFCDFSIRHSARYACFVFSFFFYDILFRENKFCTRGVHFSAKIVRGRSREYNALSSRTEEETKGERKREEERRERKRERPFSHCLVKHARCCVTFANGLLTWDVASSHLKQIYKGINVHVKIITY